MPDITMRITGDPASFKSAMGEVSSSLDKANKRAESLTAKLGQMGNTLSIGVTAPIIAMGAGVVKAAADMESLRLGLNSVATASDTTEKQLARLKEVAKLPGLGFKEAIQGSISLQSAGLSAQLAERSIKAFGNALATVGKGKAELDGVTLALRQMATKTKFSAEEVNQLAERMPQIRKAMLEAFGTADTEQIQKMGFSNIEIITKIVEQFEKLKQVSGGTKNSFANLQDALLMSADRIGSKLLPAVNEVIPRIEKLVIGVADAVDAFTKLPNFVQDAGLAMVGLVLAAGPIAKVITGLRALKAEIIAIEALAVGGAAAGGAKGVAALLGGGAAGGGAAFLAKNAALTVGQVAAPAAKAAAGITAIGAAASAAAGAGVGALVYGLNNSASAMREQKKAADQSADGMRQLNERFQGQATATKTGYEALLDFSRGLKAAQAPAKNLGEETNKHAKEVKELTFWQQVQKNNSDAVSSALQAGAKAYADWTRSHADGAANMKLYRSEMSWMNDEIAKFQAHIAKINTMNLPSAVGLPSLPTTWSASDQARESARTLGIETERERAKRIADLQRNADILREANRRGDPNVSGNMAIEAEEKLRKAIEQTGDAAKQSGKKQTEATRQVSLVMNDLAKGITDVIFKGGKMGDMFKNVAMAAAQSMTRYIIEEGIKKIAGELLGLEKTATSVFGKIFGSGASGTSGIFSNNASGGAGGSGATGKISGSASSVASAAGGALSIIGAIADVATAVSSIFGNLQMAAINKTLDLIEKETRFSQIHLLNTLNKANEYWPYMKSVWESLVRMEQRSMAVAGGSGMTFDFRGATFGANFDQDAFAKNLIKTLKNNGF